MPSPSGTDLVKFHVSLNVADVSASANFYRKLFDRAPAKQTPGYAKFEFEEPPLVLSLISARPAPGGNLNHVGIRLSNSAALVEMQMRLETAGIPTKREHGVECCHSRQTKFWVTDPDRILWELYIYHEDIEDDEGGAPSNHAADIPTATATRIIWQHKIPEPFPARIPHDDNTVHEVVLEGTGNTKSAATGMGPFLAEACRVLRPGGKVRLHGLAGDRPSKPEPPNLPGPAAIVEFVPVENEPMQAMIHAGFVHVRFEKLSSSPNFIVDDVQMREFLLVGLKPGHRPNRTTHQAIYLGPLAQVADDFGNTFPRGKRVPLNIHDWQQLTRSTVADQFLFISPEKDAAAAGQPSTRFSSSPASTS